MTANGNTIPKIRFAGFTGDWNETPMGELLSFKNGYNAGKEQYGTGKRFINVLDIIENDHITHDRIIGQVDIPPKDFEKNEVRFGDILFQRSSETREDVGQANVYLDRDKTATFGGFVIRGRPLSEFDPVFFNSMLKTAKARKDITSRSGGSTRYNIGQESLEDVLVSIAPTLPEQRKIADFLTAVDGRIGQLIQKRALLEDYKKGVMQQLFTQAIRFKDDHGNDFPDWEEVEIGEVLGYEQPTKYIVKSTEYNDEHPTPVLTAGKTFILGYTDEDDGICDTGLPLIIFDDFTTAYKFVDFPFKVKSSAMKILRANDSSWDIRFVHNAMSTIRFPKGEHKRYWIGEYQFMTIPAPSRAEQTKIANFLSAIDRKIESVASQITETQTFKRGLLQQMFV